MFSLIRFFWTELGLRNSLEAMANLGWNQEKSNRLAGRAGIQMFEHPHTLVIGVTHRHRRFEYTGKLSDGIRRKSFRRIAIACQFAGPRPGVTGVQFLDSLTCNHCNSSSVINFLKESQLFR